MVDASAEHTDHVEESGPPRSVLRGELNDTSGARRAVDANDTKFVHILVFGSIASIAISSGLRSGLPLSSSHFARSA